MKRLGYALLLTLLASGCATTRVVRLEPDDGERVVVTPREEEDASPAEARLEEDEFKAAVKTLARDVRPFAHPLRQARELFGLPERSGLFGFRERTRQIIPLGEEEARELRLLDASDDLTRGYQQWCGKKRQQPGDCLRLLEEVPLLGSDGRYALAMAIAMDSVWNETAEALEGMASPQAVMATMTSAVTMYLLLWAMPEPVSKGLAALITATAIAYLGVDTVWTLLDGWVTLVRHVDGATTFIQVREAGEAYGAVMGRNAARVFVMLATAAIGNTAGLAMKAPTLPGSAQAAVAVETQAGLQFISLGGVRSVAMAADGFTIALAPNAVAMSSRPGKPQRHHLATIRNEKSARNGGPWTPQFRRLFKRAGMELNDPENIVEVPGHRGPHPRAYHEQVLQELRAAMETCRTVVQCRETLTNALRVLAKEASTQGTPLNQLLTSRKGR
ncbi:MULTISPECIES: AHH domain-containing protein [unclassified Corallococcus]|uniref:AHH domain-containing protein n=1 Tax=unclassified Corallococcus TaxID=2685029 RepID=UPI001A8CD206|nr:MULTISPECIES: AHH domain-containing protein [unclassified Corallococcus]MBN9687632.1 AHH domain-containing protein [Corallococcus sp. NCSPR001]WAS88550.1 AHH domain-containing protein [Corallococcus sp. NCRR]